MAKSIPNVGEEFLGDNPYALKVLKIKCGFATSTPDVTIAADTDTILVEVCQVGQGVMIHGLSWLVEEAFAASSTVTIGDTVDAGGWAAATDIGATLVDSNIANPFLMLTATAAANADDFPAYTLGRVYGSGETSGMAINLTTVIDSTVWSGILDVFVVYSMAGAGVAQATS